MKKLTWLLFASMLLLQSCNDKAFTIFSYNVENLFDTEDDPATRDDDFTPDGKLKWDATRYQAKLDRLAHVFQLQEQLPDVIGLVEVENIDVLNDLAGQKVLAPAQYKIIHKNSPDKRGIDVALLYKASAFEVLNTKFILVKDTAVAKNLYTRDILYTKGIAHGKDTLHIFVNHWPSRSGGEERSRPKRLLAARTLRAQVDAVFAENAAAKIVIIGDFNDEPNNESLNETLKATNHKAPKDPTELYNLMWPHKEAGKGTYVYKDQENMLDNIIVSQAVLSGKGLSCTHADGQIFTHPDILFTKKNGTVTPNRTYVGRTKYVGGTSDHLPVFVTLKP